MYFATVVWPTSMPSLSNSPWILGAPKRVRKAHLANELANFGRCSWSAASWARLPAPIGLKARAMPTDHRFGLKDFQCIQDFGCQSIETDKHQPIDIDENQPLR